MSLSFSSYGRHGIFDWCTRRICGLTLISTFLLSAYVIGYEAWRRRRVPAHTTVSTQDRQLNYSFWTVLFAFFSLFWHTLTAGFYLRVCWAFVNVATRVEVATAERGSGEPGLGADLGGKVRNRNDVTHAIVLPSYQEDIETLRQTLSVLSSHPDADRTYDVHLAMERREKGAQEKADILIAEFSSCFRSLDMSLHQEDAFGEHPGKGSNVAWAVLLLSRIYEDSLRKDVVVTIMDADTLFPASYFTEVALQHAACDDATYSTMYTAPMVFDRNADQVSGLVRLTDIFWTGIALSGHHTGSRITLPFSAYSIPLVLVDRVGGWDVDEEAISEDIHMFIKCFFACNGNLRVYTIPHPFSSMNVVGDGTLMGDARLRYDQGLRHMWGSLDCGYVLRRSLAMWRNRKVREQSFLSRHEAFDRSYHAIPPDMLKEMNERDSAVIKLGPPDWTSTFLLWHRLLELYFMPVSLIISVATLILGSICRSHPPLPPHLRWIFTVCSFLGKATVLALFANVFLYYRYHNTCVRRRKDETRRAGLAGHTRFAARTAWTAWSELVYAPVVVVLYGVAPAVHAALSHFWSLDHRWVVTKKHR